MIRQLKKRPRSDSHTNETRKVRHSWDRLVYLVLLTAFILIVVNYLFGDRVFLRADGLVIWDRHAIESTYIVRVTDIRVKPGQKVSAGDRIFRAESAEILDRLADLSVRRAELDERLAALKGQQYMSEQMLPVIQKRAQELTETQNRIAPSAAARLTTAARTDYLQDQVMEVQSELHRLRALSKGLSGEFQAVQQAQKYARDAIERLSNHYNDGYRIAPVSGIIDYSVPADGEVYNPGEPIVTILTGAPYVLAYLPVRYIFQLNVGDEVRIHYGQNSGTGQIEAILPVTQSVPDEFHDTFRARKRKQLARISLPNQMEVPATATVRVTQNSKIGLLEVLKRVVSESVQNTSLTP